MAALLEPAGFDDVATTARPFDAAFDIGSTLAMGTGFGRLGWRYARLAALPTEAFIDRSEVLLTTARRR